MTLRSLNVSVSRAWGAALLLALVLYAVLAPWLSGVDANSQNLSAILVPPSSEHWLGTDHFGRDMWVRLADALQRSLGMALLCVATAALLGVSLGVVAAVGPRWLDQLLDGVTTMILALPGLVLVLLFAAIAPGSFWMLYLAISLILWIEYFRVSRVIAQRLVHSPEVEASKLLGFGHWYRFRRHLWPAIAPQLLTLAAFGAASSILMMASLGFVYVGIQPPTAELGLMIVEHFPYYSDAPWLLAQPLLALALLIFSCHLLGRGTGS